jgi:hypothetical protein
MEEGITFGCFLFLSSFLLFFGSRPGTNGVGMGFYHLPLEVVFSRARDRPKGRPVRYQSEAGLIRSYEYVRRTFVSLISFLSLYGWLQPRGLLLKWGMM